MSAIRPTARRTEMKYRRLITATAWCVVAVSTALFGAAASALADPEPEPPPVPAPAPGPPGLAPPLGLTPEQQCAWIAYRTFIPCNWVMPTPPPPGTPGTLYGQPQ